MTRPAASISAALLIACHCVLIGSVLAVVGALDLAWPARAAAAVLATVPLLLALRGLLAGSAYTRLWLAIAMVFYVGGGLVETIASRAAAPAAIVLLLASVLELALLLSTLKNARRASRESAEY